MTMDIESQDERIGPDFLGSHVHLLVQQAGSTDLPVLILGERGTGKSHVAHLLRNSFETGSDITILQS